MCLLTKAVQETFLFASVKLGKPGTRCWEELSDPAWLCHTHTIWEVSLNPIFCALTTAQQTYLEHTHFLGCWLGISGHMASLQGLGHAHPLELKTVPFKDLTLFGPVL